MGFLTDRRAHAEARRFADSVKPGHTYWSIEKTNPRHPGPKELLQPWVFTKPSRLTGQPMCGHMTAEGAWLRFGPLYAERPRGLMTFAESKEYEVAGPDAKSIAHELGQKRQRTKAGR